MQLQHTGFIYKNTKEGHSKTWSKPFSGRQWVSRQGDILYHVSLNTIRSVLAYTLYSKRLQLGLNLKVIANEKYKGCLVQEFKTRNRKWTIQQVFDCDILN